MNSSNQEELNNDDRIHSMSASLYKNRYSICKGRLVKFSTDAN